MYVWGGVSAWGGCDCVCVGWGECGGGDVTVYVLGGVSVCGGM